MKKSKLYSFLVWIVRHLSKSYKTVFLSEEPTEPCIFVVNHAGAAGPVDMCAKFYAREYSEIWCNYGMMEKESVPDYVRQDYWWKPGCFFEPLFIRTIPYIAAMIIPPVLRSAPTIPVYHDQRVILTFRKSIQALKNGRNIVIFPEQPSGWKSHESNINMGWIKLCELWIRSYGESIDIFPVYIDRKKHAFIISQPVKFTKYSISEVAEMKIADYLASGLRGK